MTRKGMVFDLKRCIGCQSCTLACKLENATPPGIFWTRVLETERGKYPLAKRSFIPIICNHCQDPPCLRACPTGATAQREDGIVTIDQDKCIGCKACIIACPYEARFFREDDVGYFSEGLTPFEQVGYKKHQKGVVSKCNFCKDKVDAGQEPACVQTCPTIARVFGDLDDPNSDASRLIREKYAIQLHPEEGTNPSVYYIS